MFWRVNYASQRKKDFMSKEHPGMCYNNCVQNLMYRIRDRGTRKENSGLYTSENVKWNSMKIRIGMLYTKCCVQKDHCKTWEHMWNFCCNFEISAATGNLDEQCCKNTNSWWTMAEQMLTKPPTMKIQFSIPAERKHQRNLQIDFPQRFNSNIM